MTQSTKWALITGASSGFGVDFARQLARQGYSLVLVARSEAPMQALAAELAGVRCHVVAMDLAGEGAAEQLKQQLDAAGITVDMLVNNAGFGVFGEFIGQPIERTRGMLQVNIMALTELTHVFAAGMAERGHGDILLVASNGAYQATPTYAAYCASKAYVLLFGEALHDELAPRGVNVTVVSPGISATNFLQVSGQKATLYQRTVMMTSASVVGIALAALRGKRASVVSGWLNASTAFGNRLLPRSWQRGIAYRLMKND